MSRILLLFFCLLLLKSTSLLAQDQGVIDSLFKVLETLPTPAKFDVLLELAVETQNNEPNRAATFLQQASLLRKDSTTASYQNFRYLAAVARNKLYEHEYQNTIALGDSAMTMRALANGKEKIHVLASIGTAYYFISDYEAAISNHLKALAIAEEEAVEKEKPNIFNNLAPVYLAMKSWDKAEHYLQKALPLADQFNNDYESGRARSNMAILFAMQEKYELAEEWFLRDLEFNQKRNNLYAMNKDYNNLGMVYEYLGDYQASLQNHQQALELSQSIDDKASVAIGYQNVANAHAKMGNYQQAITGLITGNQLARDLGNRNIVRDGLLFISEMYEAMEQPARALSYHQQYHALNDSIVNEQHLNAVSELEIKYQTAQKEKDILSLNEVKTQQEKALTQQSAYVKRLWFGLCFIALLSAGLFLYFRQRSKFREQQNIANSIAATELAERQRIAQDLHDSVGGSLALMSTQLKSELPNLPKGEEKLAPFIQSLSQVSSQIRQISHNLMPGELIKFGLVSAIENLTKQINNDQLNAQLHSKINQAKLSKEKEVQVYRIAQELIQNVIKHAKASELNVYLYQYEKYLSLMVEDNGVGIPTGTAKGIGLKNIQNRVRYLHGSLMTDSSEGNGTTTTIQIPLI